MPRLMNVDADMSSSELSFKISIDILLLINSWLLCNQDLHQFSYLLLSIQEENEQKEQLQNDCK